MRVVAEGVEALDQLVFLKELQQEFAYGHSADMEPARMIINARAEYKRPMSCNWPICLMYVRVKARERRGAAKIRKLAGQRRRCDQRESRRCGDNRLTFGDTELQSRIHLSRFHANLFYCAVQYIVGTRICLSTMTQPSTIVRLLRSA